MRGLLVLAVLAGSGVAAHAQAVPAQSRGQMLYETHCISCHTTQVHWRNDRQAQDWESIKANVRRWQGNTGLQWGEADIAEVARHLNDTIYHYPQTQDRVSRASSPAPR